MALPMNSYYALLNATELNKSASYSNNGSYGDYGATDPNMQTYMDVGEVLSYVLFLLITSLNLVVLLMLKCKKRDSNRLHFFILHLAIADLLVGAVTMLGDAIESSLDHMWYAGDVTCRIYRCFIVINMLASNNILIGMSLDRYFAVAIPMKFVKAGSKFSKCMVGGAWVISIVAGIFFIVYSKGENKKYGCTIDIPDSWWKPYLTTIAVLLYILPTVVIATCYIGICLIIWKTWKSGLSCPKLIVTEVLLLDMTTGHTNPSQSKFKAHGIHSGILPKAKVKSIKLTLVICLGFFLCWTPYFVYMLLDTYQAIPYNFGLSVLMGKLYPLNSVLNPLIFILFNTKMVRKICRKEEDYIMTYTTTNGNCKIYLSSTSLTSAGKRTSRSGSSGSASRLSIASTANKITL